MLNTFYARVIWREQLPILLTLDEMRAIPTIENTLWQYKEELIQIEYKPGTSDFDEALFRKKMTKIIKNRFKNVVSIEVMDDVSMLKN